MLSKQLEVALTFFKNEVANHYQKHEQTFDLESFHGRFHILRCLFLADCMHLFYESKSLFVEIEQSYFAILFHDIMREDNGIDLWESQSALKCSDFLIQKGFSQEYASQTSALILKSNHTNFEEQVLYDVDVLDYHRFFYLPEERHLFEDFRLKFAGPNDISNQLDIVARNKIIRLSQQLVKYCETIPVSISTSKLIKIVSNYYIEVKPW